MAIRGNVELEDVTIDFEIDQDNVAHVRVAEAQWGTREPPKVDEYTCPGADFMKALAIAVHFDGTPDYREDYEAAERAMRTIRWIP